ncbi:MAG: DUF4031 domain-containing protein, partial [Lapillicoccus sp.]
DLAVLAPEADAARVAAVGTDLLARWTEPHRRYHGTRHLVEMFWALEDLTDAGELDEADAVVARVAAWFHDAVYDPAAAAGANEGASAALARDRLTELGLDPAHVRTVDDLVLMTADHVAVDGDALQRAFHDADLWILAADEERFDDYCAQVREEYASVPDAVFRAARAAILRSLTAGDGLYLTGFARREWEGAARTNLTRELERLS